MGGMPKVLADVVDIKVDLPKRSDMFVADTNVWLVLNYAPLSLVNPHSYRTVEYPAYVKKIRGAGARMAHSSLTLAEMAHVIEGKEYEVWRAIPGNEGLKLKHFRRDEAERQRVFDEVEGAWAATKAASTCVDCLLDAQTADATLERLRLFPLDGYDAMMLAAIRGKGLSMVLTDDFDFITVSGLTVFTANPESIRLAQMQGRLIHRS